MATAFIGLPVLIRLKSDPTATVTGVLSSLDPTAGSLTLTEARSQLGGVERLDGIRILSRSEVAGLELLSVHRTKSPATVQYHVQPHSSNAHRQDSPVLSPVASPSRLSGSPQPGRQRSRSTRAGRRHRALHSSLESEEGEEGDVSSVSNEPRRSQRPAEGQLGHLNQDFDFGAGLASFNKHAVFEQIRSKDDTDPSLRLVAHNRNPSARSAGQTKLLPTESVLSASELQEQRAERRDVQATVRQQSIAREPEGDGAGEKGERRSAGARLAEVHRQMNELAVGEGADGPETESLRDGARRTTMLTTSAGVVVPTVTTRQWKDALSIAQIESSPTDAQRVEASSHALVTYLARSLPLFHSRPSASDPTRSPFRSPSVCLLCTDSFNGLVAIRAGTTLANRGCNVVALVEDGGDGEGGRSESWRTAVRVLSSAGGRIVRDVADLPTRCDLVIDALAPSLRGSGPAASGQSVSSSARSTPGLESSGATVGAAWQFAQRAAAWAVHQHQQQQQQRETAPFLLSLDVPFGLDPDSGALHPGLLEPVCPTHLLAFGLPRPALVSPLSSAALATTQLALADVGFPPAVWARVGVVDEPDSIRNSWDDWQGIVQMTRR